MEKNLEQENKQLKAQLQAIRDLQLLESNKIYRQEMLGRMDQLIKQLNSIAQQQFDFNRVLAKAYKIENEEVKGGDE